MKLKNRKLTDDEFFKIREDVLTHWPTGKDVDLEEACRYLEKIPKEKNFALKLKTAKEEGKTLAQPRAGVALIDEHITLLKYLEFQIIKS